MTEFFMPMIPPTATAQEHKVRIRKGKPVFYDPPAVTDARAKLRAHLYPHRPGKPFTGPVRLVVKWLFPVCGKHRHGEYKATRPDTDNLQKLLKDCMTECGFWKDDALVASEVCEKLYSNLRGIWIHIEQIGGDDSPD